MYLHFYYLLFVVGGSVVGDSVVVGSSVVGASVVTGESVVTTWGSVVVTTGGCVVGFIVVVVKRLALKSANSLDMWFLCDAIVNVDTNKQKDSSPSTTINLLFRHHIFIWLE